MNIDDPKLTAFALDELEEPERSTIARAVAESPEAQRTVDETRELAQMLKSEYSTERREERAAPANLIDIRDDPLFWSVARPLAIAAALTVLAILGAIVMGSYKSRHDSNVAVATRQDYSDLEGEEKPQPEATSDFSGPANIANPLQADAIRRIDRVVIGELDPHLENGEIRVIETINDAYRLQGLKKRLTTPVLSKRSHREFVGRAYELTFLDRSGQIIASASFYRTSDLGFVLQPAKNAYERAGHYFSQHGDVLLPGEWKSGVDYSGYVIPFSDWNDCVGYSPGV